MLLFPPLGVKLQLFKREIIVNGMKAKNLLMFLAFMIGAGDLLT